MFQRIRLVYCILYYYIELVLFIGLRGKGLLLLHLLLNQRPFIFLQSSRQVLQGILFGMICLKVMLNILYYFVSFIYKWDPWKKLLHLILLAFHPLYDSSCFTYSPLTLLDMVFRCISFVRKHFKWQLKVSIPLNIYIVPCYYWCV